MKKLTDIEVTKIALEEAIPEYPDVERTPENELRFQEMLMDEYISKLSRTEKRKIKNKKFKFSEEVKRKLR